MTGKLRIGALGNSRVLSRFMPASQSHLVGQIEIIATRSQQSAEVARERYPDRLVVVGYEELLEREDVDAIYVCLPPALHFLWAKKSLEAGKHVLIEKPAVLTANEAVTLGQIASSNQLLAMEAWWYRFHPLIHSLRQLIASGVLGNIKHVSSSFSYVNSDPKDSRWISELGGGALYDMFSYHIDFLNYVLGIRNQDIDLIQAFASKQSGVDACVAAELITHSGTVCNFMAGLNKPSLCKTFIIGDQGSVEVPHVRVLPEFVQASYIYYSHQGPQVVEFPQMDAYILMLKNFSQSCVNRLESPVLIEDTVANTLLLERVKAAIDE